MTKLIWRSATHTELAQLLRQAQLDDSRAVGPVTVYHLTVAGQDVLAVALADGQALVIETAPKPTVNRRHGRPHPVTE